MRLLNILLGHTIVFGVAILVSSSCSVAYPTTAFRCSPGGEAPSCPTEGDSVYQCCSDDPAALDFTDINTFVTPNYQGRGGEGTPLFSGGNNPLSKSGMCVKLGSVPATGALADVNAQGCPVPCNPTWSGSDIASVCGDNTICCQTTELDPTDCVFDEDAGNSGCFRPVTGADIDSVPSLTNWGGNTHKTHQDPSGINCEAFVVGLSPTFLADNNLESNDVLRACYHRLTVANQRGFCLGGAGVNVCPLAQPTYRDACEQANDANFLQGCSEVDFP